MDVNLKTPGIIVVTLKPNEVFLGERGSMSFCDGGIEYTVVETSILKSAYRWLGGESFFSIVKFHNRSNLNQTLHLRYDVQQSAWFHHNTTETDIMFLDLTRINGSLIIEPGAYFASTDNVSVGVHYDSNWSRTFLGFGKPIRQRISGNGTVFIKKNRWVEISERIVEKGKSVTIDPKEVYGYSLNSLVRKNGFSITNFLAGEGFSSYKFEGPALILTYKNRPSRGADNSYGRVFQALLMIVFITYILTILF